MNPTARAGSRIKKQKDMKTRTESYFEYIKTEFATKKRGDRIVEGKCGVIHFDKKGNVISSWDRETNRVEF